VVFVELWGVPAALIAQAVRLVVVEHLEGSAECFQQEGRPCSRQTVPYDRVLSEFEPSAAVQCISCQQRTGQYGYCNVLALTTFEA
jgi:hypothetical protein